MAITLVNTVTLMGTLGQHGTAVAVADQALSYFAGNDISDETECVSTTLANKGLALGHLGRHQEAIAVYDELLARFEGSDSPAVQTAIQLALDGRAEAIEAMTQKKKKAKKRR